MYFNIGAGNIFYGIIFLLGLHNHYYYNITHDYNIGRKLLY